MKWSISAECLLDAAEGGLQCLWRSSHPTMQTSLGLSCSGELAAQLVSLLRFGRVTVIFLLQLPSCQLRLFLGQPFYAHSALQHQTLPPHEGRALL